MNIYTIYKMIQKKSLCAFPSLLHNMTSVKGKQRQKQMSTFISLLLSVLRGIWRTRQIITRLHKLTIGHTATPSIPVLPKACLRTSCG